MSTSIAGPVTAEEWRAMPEDGMDREAIRGQLEERPMTYQQYFHTVTVHRPDAPPEMFNDQQALGGGQVLPGLEIPVAEMFE